VNRWRKIYHANSNQQRAEAAILISDKADFRIRNTVMDNEEHYRAEIVAQVVEHPPSKHEFKPQYCKK
jgi:hypothetical protein